VQAERIDGAAEAQTSNGNIVLREIDGACTAKTANGAIEIRGARGAGIDARTTNGQIDVQAAPSAKATITLSASTGAIQAVLPASLAADLDAHTSLGAVKVDFGTATVEGVQRKLDRVRAKLNGGGGKIEASSSMGSVTLKFAE
jgi:DUF4097 and DUF4098 domain-containing protein YvlB